MFNKFPSIEGFHNVRKNVRLGSDPYRIDYRAKIKLHGTNAAVNITKDGPKAQSRRNWISSGSDNMGFATWMERNMDYWNQFSDSYTFFGEWFGKQIMKGTSANEVPGNYFAVFAVQKNDVIYSEPSWIQELLNSPGEAPSQVLVIPWYNEKEYRVDFSNQDNLQEIRDTLNQLVTDVESTDPFIQSQFDINGPGEGLVFYPQNGPNTVFHFSKYAFKAKGEKHQATKQKKPVQIDPEKLQSIEEFCDKTLTQTRLEQAMMETVGSMDFDKKYLGPFLSWVGKDIKKECQAELESSGLEWKDVGKMVQGKAREWFLNQT